jgi:EF-hand domain-containing family member B
MGMGGPGTPEHIKKYRKSFMNQPGLKQVHPGVINDGLPVGEDYRFGKKTIGSEGVNDVIKAQNLKGLADKFNDIKEEKYASRLKEPLAKGYERGYNWPEKVEPEKH